LLGGTDENHQKSQSRNPNWQFKIETFRKGGINADGWVRIVDCLETT
jgi:hypothetical protein